MGNMKYSVDGCSAAARGRRQRHPLHILRGSSFIGVFLLPDHAVPPELFECARSSPRARGAASGS